MPGYRITRKAADDIAAIYMEGLGLFGFGQADAYHDGLTATFEFLANYPRAARLREEIDPPIRAYRYMSHSIVYELDGDDTVVVLRVRHNREDWQGERED